MSTTTSITPIRTDQSLLAAADRPADQNPALVYIAGLKSPHTRRNVARYLNQIADLLSNGRQDARGLDWAALRFQHTAAVQARLMDVYKPGTVNVMLSALRGVLKTAWRLGHMTNEDMTRACDVKNVSGESLPAGRDIKPGEFMALANVCYEDATAAGIRDSAIIGLLYVCGLRRSELVKLMVSDIDLDAEQIRVIRGKGRKDRLTYAANGALDALRDWLTIRGSQPGALFLPITKAGHITRYDTERNTPFETSGELAGMTSQAVYNMLKKRAKQAGVSDFSPHDFRRTFVGDMLDRGVDIATVANIAGHASVDTTRRYDRRPEAVKQAAAGKLHYPYKRREKLIEG